MLSGRMPGLLYTGIARHTSTTLQNAATAMGGHHLPGISLRAAKPNATQTGANSRSCSTTRQVPNGTYQ